MEEITSVKKKHKREEDIIQRVIERFKTDNAFLAALKRADNPATEYQSWEYLVQYGVNLEYERDRLPYVTVLAALARVKPGKDGFMDFGRSIARSYDDGNNNDQAKAKLRRALACDSVEEICAIIRPIIRLIQSKGAPLSYSSLLYDLIRFHTDYSIKIKARWAENFFGKHEEENL